MAQPISLIAHDLGCQRGGRTLFQGLSFALGAGQALLVSGRNGAGKTTLLRLIAGLLPWQEGRLSLEGADEEGALPESCAYVGHLNGIKAAQSVRENLAFAADFLDGEKVGAGRVRGERESVESALAAFGLGSLAHLPAGLLSAGQKRKLALSRLVVAPRPIWLLDEPSVSLDASAVKALDAAIGKHLKEGGLAMVASHTPLKVRFAGTLVLGEGRLG
jgi:heme exporter protein A